MSPEPLSDNARKALRHLRSKRRRRRSTPEKRRVHTLKTEGGAVVALYDDGTWGYLWRPDEVSYEEDL